MTTKMNILNIMFSRGLGGIEQSFVDYTEALKLEGHKVTCIIYPQAAIKSKIVEQGANIVEIRNMGSWDWFAKAYIRKVRQQTKADMVIAHGNRAVSLSRDCGLPVYGVTHNYSTKKLIGLAGIFATTDDLRNKVVSEGQAPERVFKVPNMIRLPRELPEFGTYKKPPVIGTMGRFVKKKGFDVYIKALRILADEGVEFRAVLGGGGEEESELKKLADDLDLANRLEFIGWVQDKKKFFDSVDVFCLPSHHEPFGIILLEAFAHTKPVVSTQSEGPGEIATDGENAILTPINDASAMAKAIKKLISSEDLGRKLAIGGCNSVKKYDVQAVAKTIGEAISVATPH